eukprot:scaffold67993_cov12-Tisochrysis_lutea.AAC.1
MHAAHCPAVLRTQLSSKGAAAGAAAQATPAPLTAEVICSSQWGAHACMHPLYSAFRSCAATETTSVAGSMDGSECMLPPPGGVARDEPQPQQPQQVQDLADTAGHPAGDAASGCKDAGAAGSPCGGLPTLQESLPAPLSPRDGGAQLSAAEGGNGQGQVLAGGMDGDIRQAPSNASSIGDWLVGGSAGRA